MKSEAFRKGLELTRARLAPLTQVSADIHPRPSPALQEGARLTRERFEYFNRVMWVFIVGL